MSIIISDLDGTLANIEHRLHYIRKGPKYAPNWDKFHEACVHDEPIQPVISVLQNAKGTVDEIVIVSGRNDRVRRPTFEWLIKHKVPFDRLLMRPDGDYRPDDQLKREILHMHIDKAEVLFVLDDRTRLVEMWREEGLICLQVAPGDF